MNGMPSVTALLRAMDDDEPGTPPYRPDPVAQAMELRARYARMQQRSSFAPGQLVRSKIGIGTLKDDARIVLIVVRFLSGSEYDKALVREWLREERTAISGMEPDIVCADLMRSKGAQLTFFLASSYLIEPVSDEELDRWKVEQDAEAGA